MNESERRDSLKERSHSRERMRESSKVWLVQEYLYPDYPNVLCLSSRQIGWAYPMAGMSGGSLIVYVTSVNFTARTFMTPVMYYGDDHRVGWHLTLILSSHAQLT